MDKQKQKYLTIDQSLYLLSIGDYDAMDVLYGLIKDDVYAYALSKTKNRFDAEDIMQDTFIRIFENAKLYQSIGTPMAWIFTIELNIINRYYQLKARNNLIKDEQELDIIKESESTNLEKLERKDYLNNLLRNLDEEEREVISLHLVSNLKFREIAKLLNRPLSTILSKYNRAIKKIKKIAKEEN